MNIYSYEKVNNFRIFSPRADNSHRKLKLNNQNNVVNFNEYTKFSNIGNDNPINIYYSPKNISSPQNPKIPKIYSPLHRKLSRLYRSSSQKNMSRPLSSSTRALPSVQSFSYIKSPKSKSKNKSKIKDKKENYFNIEKEKLYQETYQIKKVVKILTKKLSLLKQENLKKDNQINRKQKKINDIIFSNNDSMYENTNLLYNNNNINNISFNDFSINSSININNNNNNNMSINSNLNIMNKKNLPTLSLIIKIKKAITQMNNEIKTEKEKYEKLKRSLFLTKMNELKTESTILEEQINKIKTFVNKAFILQEENNKKKNDYLNLKDNINKQLDIIKSLNERSCLLDKEENDLKDNLDKIKRNLISKNKKIKINKSKLDLLIEKNNDLSNNKNMIEQSYTIKINNIPIEIKSFYTSQISKLNKLINFYTTQCKYSDNEINKLKDKRFKLIGTEKKEKLNQKEYFSFKNEKNVSDTEKINNLRKILKDSNQEEIILKKKLNIYRNKLKELENSQEQEDPVNKSQIEFGIDVDNPFYTEDNNNLPEKSNKFTSSQFNQFTYILFKNFEAKGISFDESKTKIINPFIEYYNKNKITNVVYPSNEFDLIVDEYTKIIMDVLNCNNKYNYSLTRTFIGALFFNSECNLNKLIEYLTVLFSYTRNYYLEEEKYINKLKNKYKEQTEKLIKIIKDNILYDSSSKYFQLLKMKDLVEKNEINLKDKYIEFLFYYMKKYDDPEAKLDDLKYSILNDILPLYIYENNNNLNEINIINNNKNIEENNIKTAKEEEIQKETKKETQKENIIENKKEDKIEEKIEVKMESKMESIMESKKENGKGSLIEMKDNIKDNNVKEKKKQNDIIMFDDTFLKNEKKSFTQENFEKEKNDKNNSDDLDEEDSMTEITNEEYVKQLKEAIALMHSGLNNANTTFSDLMANVIQKRKILGKFYECITIEDFNDQLKSINIVLSDLKLSCLCSKYSIPNELRLIDKNKIEIDIQKHKNGTLKFEEDDNENDI